jgi:hypothetical protein
MTSGTALTLDDWLGLDSAADFDPARTCARSTSPACHRHPDDPAEGRSSLSQDWYMAEVK